MSKLVLYMTISILFNQANAQSKGGIEQYSYLNNSGVGAVMPIVHFETRAGWHLEARYNYEELKTLSLYFGKIFTADGVVSWSVTPMAGFLVGNLKGISTAVNIDFECGNFFLSSQPQFVVAMDRMNANFFYNWAEFGYNIRKWLYGGVTLQHTIAGSDNQIEPGVTLGFNVKKFSFPVYFFNPGRRDKYFILGVNWEWN